MSRKGGYKIIDLKGLDFSSSMVIDGIYESIEDNYGKPLLFSGIVIGGVEKDDVFANAVVNGDGYDVTLYGQTLHISNVDVLSKKEHIAAVLSNELEDPNCFMNLKNGVYSFYISSELQDLVYEIEKPIFVTNADAMASITQPTIDDFGSLEFLSKTYFLIKTNEYYLLTDVYSI